MSPGYQRMDQSFAIPKKNRRWRIPLLLMMAVLACAAVFVAYAWDDISYVLPSPLKQTTSEKAFYEASAQDAILLQETDSGSSITRYVYESLNDGDKEKYRIVYEALSDCRKHAFPTDDLNEIRRIEDCVMADFPELADRAALVHLDGGIFTPAYVAGVALGDTVELKSVQSQIDAVMQECFASIDRSDDDYTKAKIVYEWLAENTSYGKEYASYDDRIIINASGTNEFQLDEGSSIPREHGQTVYNALVQKRAVCAGYAKAYQYLLQRLGIECTYISGTALDGLHAWCLAKLDGDYYFIDPTWGDPEYESNWDIMQDDQNLDHRFFAVTTQDISLTHEADNSFFIPYCTATADNYYVREGLLFDTADIDRLGRLVSQAFSEGSSLSIRCATKEVYEELLHNAIENGEIGRYTPTGSYQYASDNTDLCTITIWPLSE